MDKVKKEKNVMRYIAIGLIILGALFLFMDREDKLQSKELIEEGIQTTATVERVKYSTQSGRGDWIYPAIVSYVDSNNIKYENEIQTHYIIHEGDIIDIYYNANNPDIVSAEPYIEYEEGHFWQGVVVGIIGILLLIKSFYKKTKIMTEERKDTFSNILPIGFIIIAIFMFINTYYLQERKSNDFSKNAVQTVAVIDSVSKDHNLWEEYYSQPVNYRLQFHYTALDGKEYHSRGTTYTEYEQGENINIYYDKDNPYKTQLFLEQDDISQKRFDTFMIFVVIGIACAMFIYNRRKRKNL